MVLGYKIIKKIKITFFLLIISICSTVLGIVFFSFKFEVKKSDYIDVAVPTLNAYIDCSIYMLLLTILILLLHFFNYVSIKVASILILIFGFLLAVSYSYYSLEGYINPQPKYFVLHKIENHKKLKLK